jgi:DNA-binding XRE family transcriptional regulator
MTVRLTPTSPRFAAAVKFGELLSRRMSELEIGQGIVKGAARVSRASVVEFRNGRNLPTLEVALRIAEALNEPRLAEIVRQARTMACQRCGRPFVNERGFPKRYCSAGCRELGQPESRNRRSSAEAAVMILRGEMLRMGQVRKQSIGRALTMLDDFHAPAREALAVVDAYQDAVTAMCASCEPDGLCRTPECPLRAVSPLSLISSDVGTEPARKPLGRWGRQEEHEAYSEAMRRRHAAQPEWAQQTGTQMRARHAAMTPEQKAAWIQKISDTKRQRFEARKAAVA